MSAIYYLTTDPSLFRKVDNGVTTFFAASPGNADWIAFQAWIAAGNAPGSADGSIPPHIVPPPPAPIDPRTGKPYYSRRA